MSNDYQQFKQELKDKQHTMSHDEILDQMEHRSEYAIDLNNLPKVNHVWVRRGDVISCEGADHPSHRHFLTKK